MTPDAAMDVIEPLIETWATAQSVTVAWPNVDFTPPATANWAKVDFIWGAGAIFTKGAANGQNVVTGILQLALFGPKDGGDGALSALAETARAVFNRKRLASPNDEVTFSAVSGARTMFEESWRSLVLSAPFQVVETVP
jgi:hypothetical protein